MKNKLAKLVDLKSIITIIITSGLLYGFIVDKITNEQFFSIAIMIYTFYFNKKKDGEENEVSSKYN